MTSHNVNLLTASGVLHEWVGIVLSEAQGLTTDKTYAFECLAVEHVGIVLHKSHQILRIVETARIINPPVGLILQRYGIHIHTMVFHPLQIGVQPWEELVVAIQTKLATLIALVVGIATLGCAIGLVFSGRRPWSAKHDAITILDNLNRRQRTIPVVVAPVVASETWRDFHAHDVQSNL